MNKRIMILDTLSFCIGALLLLLIKCFYSFFGNNNISNVLFGLSSVAIVLVIMLITYRLDIVNVNMLNFFYAIACFLLFFLLYSLPFWGFIGQRGANNSVLIIFMFMFGAKYLLYLSKILRNRSRNVSLNIQGNTLNSSKNFFKIISVYAWILLFASIVLVFVNTFYPVAEMGGLVFSYFSK